MANQIEKTFLIVESSDTDYSVPGGFTAEQLVSQYGHSIPGLSNMTHTTREEWRADLNGYARIVTFKPRQGTKG